MKYDSYEGCSIDEHPLTFPKHYHEDDVNFINKMLDKVTPHAKIVACEGYSNLWNKVVRSDIPSHKKLNVARKTCNIRLRKFIEDCKL